MMTHDTARALYSEYLDGALDPKTHAHMEAWLLSAPDAQKELDALRRTLSMLHGLPPREPSLDLWAEFAPHMKAYAQERRLPWPERARLMGARLLDGIGAGLILWTHALAGRTRARWERHLLHDPLARDGGRE